MGVEEEVVDLAATVDYIRDRLVERADSFDFEDAAALRDAALEVKAAADLAASLLETTIVGQLEAQPVRTVGNRLFKRKRRTAKRFDHEAIAASVGQYAQQAAVDKETGATSVDAAVVAALQAMRELYLSASTQAKTTKFDRYGVDVDEVVSYEDQGWRLEVEQLDERQP
jgi:hypothetical protein